MNVGIIKITKEISPWQKEDFFASFVCSHLFKCGIKISQIITSDAAEENIKNTLNSLSKKSHAIVVCCDVSCLEKLKDVVGDITKAKTAQNSFAKTGIEAYFKSLNQAPTKNAIDGTFLPTSCRCILCTSSEFCGFTFDLGDASVFVIPNKEIEIKNMFLGSVLPSITKHLDTNFAFAWVNVFSVPEPEIKNYLDFIITSNKIGYTIITKGLVCEIILRFDRKTSKTLVDGVVDRIYDKYGKFIFVGVGENLEDVACEKLANIQKSTTILEGATLGMLAKSLISSPNFKEEFLNSAQIFISSKKENELNPTEDEEQYIKRVACEKAPGESICLINLKSKIDKNAYLIGIGEKDNLSVYKIRLVGDEDEVILKLIQTTFFYLIKKLN